MDGTITNAVITINPSTYKIYVAKKGSENPSILLPQVYLVGNFGDSWSDKRTDAQFTIGEGYTYTLTNKALNGEPNYLKIKIDDTVYGTGSNNDVNVNLGTEYEAKNWGSAFVLPKGSYNITFNRNTHKFTVTAAQSEGGEQGGGEGGEDPQPPTPPTPSTVNVYWDNANTSSWTAPHIYYYADENAPYTTWPGVEMTLVEGTTTIYSFAVPADTEVVIFNNGEENGNVQTADLTAVANHVYTMEGNGADKGDYDSYTPSTPEPPTPPVIEEKDVYLVGNFGDEWSESRTDAKFSLKEDTEYVYELSNIALNGNNNYFKIKVDNTIYGVSGNDDINVALGTEYEGTANGPKAFVLPKGTYNFTLNINTHKFTVTAAQGEGGGEQGGEDPTPSTVNVYWDNANTSWSAPHIFYYGGTGTACAAWPGETMNLVEGTIYSYTIPADTKVVIFNNGDQNGTAGSTQTANLTAVANHVYTMKANSEGSDEGDYDNYTPSTPEPPVVEQKDVYLVGDFGDEWKEDRTDFPLTLKEGTTNIYQIKDVTLTGTCYFKFKIDGTIYSTGGEDINVDYGQTYYLRENGNAFVLSAGKYTIELNVTALTFALAGSFPGDYDPHGVTPSGTLPILYLNVKNYDGTEGDEILSRNLPDKNYRKGKYWIVGADGQPILDADGQPLYGSEEAPLDLDIKARGNYTRTGFAKKPFKLKLKKAKNLLGVNRNGAESKHWTILAHADDNYGYMRNFTGFRLGELIGLPWTPNQQPIEVVINGDYRGLYFLTEGIRIEEGRVDIASLDDEVTEPALISGGYLIELDNYDEPTEAQIQMDEKSCVWGHQLDKLRVTFNTPEVYSDVQRRFVNEQFTAMNNYVGANNNALWSYIDLDDAVRYYLVKEIISDYESFHGSTYMFRDRGEGKKWHFSPLWDCGNAFNGNTNQFFYDCDPFGNTWIPSMRNNGKFNEKLTDTWKWFMSKCYSPLISELETYANSLKSAAQKDYDRWHDAPMPSTTNASPVVDNRNMDDRLNAVKNHLNAKIGWLQNQWGQYNNGDYQEPAHDTTEAVALPDWAKPEPIVAQNTGTLPVVYLKTDANADVNYGVITNGTVYFDPLETGFSAIAKINKKDTPVDAENPMATEIKGRGSDWDYANKPSYKLKLGTKTEISGLDKSKHFVLMAYSNNVNGNTLLENYAGHELSRLLNLSWTPSMIPVELVVNGEYKGLYMLGQNIRADRMGIDENANGDDWIVELDNYALDEEKQYSWVNGANNHHVVPVAPDFADYADNAETTEALSTALAGHMSSVHDAIYFAAENPLDRTWTEVIDPEQAAKFYIVQEIMDDVASFSTNFYMHHAAGGTWKFGPVWDFSCSLSQENGKKSLIHSASDYDGALIKELYKNAYFRWYVVTTYQKFLTGAVPVTVHKPAKTMARVEGDNQTIDDVPEYNPVLKGTLADLQASVTAMSAKIATSSANDAEKLGLPAVTSGTSLNTNLFNSTDYLGIESSYGGAGWNMGDAVTGIESILNGAIDYNDIRPVYYDVMGRVVTKPVAGNVYIVLQGGNATRVLYR